MKVFQIESPTFNLGPEASLVEIGQADELVIVGSSRNSATSFRTGRVEIDLHNPPDLAVVGWKTPMPVAINPPRIEPLSSSFHLNTEIQNRNIIICALVHMMGGSVIVSEYEAAQAYDRLDKLQSMVQNDPTMFILKLEDD